DHAVAHNPNYLHDRRFPAQYIGRNLTRDLGNALQEEFKVNNLVLANSNYQLYLNDAVIDSADLDKSEVKEFIINQLNKEDGILIAFDNEEISEVNLPLEVRERFLNGFNHKRGGDIQ